MSEEPALSHRTRIQGPEVEGWAELPDGTQMKGGNGFYDRTRDPDKKPKEAKPATPRPTMSPVDRVIDEAALPEPVVRTRPKPQLLRVDPGFVVQKILGGDQGTDSFWLSPSMKQGYLWIIPGERYTLILIHPVDYRAACAQVIDALRDQMEKEEGQVWEGHQLIEDEILGPMLVLNPMLAGG